jgi:hypothetical protein
MIRAKALTAGAASGNQRLHHGAAGAAGAGWGAQPRQVPGAATASLARGDSLLCTRLFIWLGSLGTQGDADRVIDGRTGSGPDRLAQGRETHRPKTRARAMNTSYEPQAQERAPSSERLFLTLFVGERHLMQIHTNTWGGIVWISRCSVNPRNALCVDR